MKLYIRADANNYIATGHVMRCISIAQEASRQGCEVKFIVADYNGKELLEKYNMPYICLHTTWNDLNGELDKISEVIKSENPDFILVDSYYVTERYLLTLRDLCKVAYIDDLNKFVYPCDVLICYANYYRKFEYEKRYPKTTKLLLGSMYAPLRQEFTEIEKRYVNERVREILILSGGTDRFEFVKDFLQEIEERIAWHCVNITVLCGMYYGNYSKLVEKYNKNKNIKIHMGISSVKEYMQKADICISAGGTTLYELCACGTPTVCYTLADNQLDNVRGFMKDKAILYAGDVREERTCKKVVENVEMLMSDFTERCRLSQCMREIVDGKGAKRIMNSIYIPI